MTPSPLPFIRLKPKIRAKGIRYGFPWVYDNELVTDRRTKSLAPGTVAVLQDSDRQDLALVAVNPSSRIMARVLDKDVSAQIDTDWFASKLSKALALREALYPEPFYRLVHAEADGLPGIVIDRFGDIAVVQPNAAWAEQRLSELTAALVAVTGVGTVLKNASGRARGLEGLDDVSGVLHGNAPTAPVEVPMNGALYLADLVQGQKTGLYFDQRDNHKFAARLGQGGDVLDVFSHVGGFALATLAGGAKSALAVDGSEAALALAEASAKHMGMQDQFAIHRSDAFEALSELAAQERLFDVVICDPPAFAPNKRALETGLRAYEKVARLATPLVREGGYLVLCSCSHAASLDKFRSACLRGIGRAGRTGSIIHTGQAGPDHPLHPQLAESGYLKALFFRL